MKIAMYCLWMGLCGCAIDGDAVESEAAICLVRILV